MITAVIQVQTRSQGPTVQIVGSPKIQGLAAGLGQVVQIHTADLRPRMGRRTGHGRRRMKTRMSMWRMMKILGMGQK